MTSILFYIIYNMDKNYILNNLKLNDVIYVPSKHITMTVKGIFEDHIKATVYHYNGADDVYFLNYNEFEI